MGEKKMKNKPLTIEGIINPIDRLGIVSNVRSAKLLLKEKVPNSIRLGNNSIIQIHRYIDECFNIPDGDK
jgi:hypothetical protein